MKTSLLARLPFLLALVVAIATMGTDVYQICAWNHGTEKTAPWRSKLSKAAIVTRLSALSDHMREWCGSLAVHPLLTSERGEASVDLLTGGMAGAIHGSRLKVLRQQAEDLKNDYNSVNREMAAIGDAISAGNREMTADERKTFEGLKTKKASLKARLDDNTEMLAVAEEVNTNAKKATVVPVVDADEKAGRVAAGEITVKDRAEDDPKRGFATPREYLKAVMGYGKTRKMDARLKPLHQQATAGSDEQSGFADPYGGFLVPVAFSPNLMSVQADGDPTVGRTTPIPMDAPMVKINARVDKNHATSVSGGLTVTRHPEAESATASRMKFEQLGLEASELIGLAYATESIMTDSPSSFAAIIAAGFKDEFNAKVLDEKINGAGVGEYLGVLASPCLISVAKDTGQAAATITKENIDGMAARCWRYGQAIWLANHNTRKQLRSLVLKVGTGGAPVPYFTQSVDGQEYLDGRPIFFTEFAKSLGTSGDLILGVWSEYLEGTYQPMQSAESIHVRFVQHERAFKFWVRNDGMPWWSSVLTPRNGDTLSPFVVLDTRA